MSQPDRSTITINCKNVNIYFGTQAAAQQTLQLRTDALFSPVIPMPGATLPVRPSTTSALGTICAQVTYDGSTLPLSVQAWVYPLEYFPADPPASPPTQAVTGICTTRGSTAIWSWNSSNPVPGANYSSGGNQNKLAIWRQDSTSWSFDGSVLFTGLPGTTGPCGSGSGSGSSTRQNAWSPRKSYPKMWNASIRGFKGTILASFNANWALRLVPKTAVPTWDNGGDEGGNIKVALTLDEQRGWTLTLSVQEIRITYMLPFKDHAFGPLRFPARETDVAHIGRVSLPPIDVVAM
jgi:hypothetical protein